MTLHIADVSEFQGAIDWARYGHERPAVIVRAGFGGKAPGGRADKQWDANRDGARTHCQVRGWYHYLTPKADAVDQAEAFCQRVGVLHGGEFAILDIEEGDGLQSPRALAWLAYVDARLGGSAWIYTYWPYAVAHLQKLEPFGDRHRWIAAYQKTPPKVRLDLWQHTNAERHPGIANPCDCSIFGGDVNSLLALIGSPAAGPAPVPEQTHPIVTVEVPEVPPQNKQFFDFPQPPTADGRGWRFHPIALDKISWPPIAQGGNPPRGELWPGMVFSANEENGGTWIDIQLVPYAAGSATPGYTLKWFD